MPLTELAADLTERSDVCKPAGFVEADGGGVILVAVEEDRVDVRLKGLCLDCPSAPLTMRLGIERTLKERLPWIREVHRVA